MESLIARAVRQSSDSLPFSACIDAVADATQAQQAFHEAEHSLKLSVEEKTKAEEELADLFSAEGFGLSGEWKKLEGDCLELDTGEYVPLLS